MCRPPKRLSLLPQVKQLPAPLPRRAAGARSARAGRTGTPCRGRRVGRTRKGRTASSLGTVQPPSVMLSIITLAVPEKRIKRIDSLCWLIASKLRKAETNVQTVTQHRIPAPRRRSHILPALTAVPRLVRLQRKDVTGIVLEAKLDAQQIGRTHGACSPRP
jgi:hypothetical protein